MKSRPSPPLTPPKEKQAHKKPAKKQVSGAIAEKVSLRSLSSIPVVESVTQAGGRGNEGPSIEKVNRFLHAVVANCGNITAASEVAEISRMWVYLEERRNEEFAQKFREAQQMGLDALEDEARRRAAQGVERGIYHKGELVDTERVYSDTLMTLLLKGGKPEKYKDRTEITGNSANPFAVEVGPSPLVMGFLEGLREGDDNKR